VQPFKHALNAVQQPSLHVVAALAHWSRHAVQAAAWQMQPGIGVWPQPLAEAHVSVVQGLWSSQSSAEPPPQLPPPHCSPAVQASPSSQGPAVLVWTHEPPTHESAVHALVSEQLIGVPTQLPAAHSSPVVQALPSLQVEWSGRTGFEQAPVVGLQVPAVWHWSDATQVTGVPATQPPL